MATSPSKQNVDRTNVQHTQTTITDLNSFPLLRFNKEMENLINLPDENGNSTSQFKNNKIIELEKINAQLQDRIKSLEKFCTSLREENKSLREEILAKKNPSNSEEVQDIIYETDEDELAKETEWIVHRKRASKKRKPNGSPIPISDNSAKETTSSAATSSNPIKKPQRPPPIVVNNMSDINKLHKTVKENAKQGFSTVVMNNNSHKVITFDVNDYRETTKALTNDHITWHSYENKQTRPIRVIAKNLHRSSDPNDIVTDLNKQGFKATNAFNKRKFGTKEELDMFVLSFDHSENINKIYEIKTILNQIIKIEPIKLTKQIPQCKNCQSFNHTKNYCSKESRCVKCAGKHETKKCDKPVGSQPKCCNCGEPHPASYRGCMVAKELQKLRDKKRKNNPDTPVNTNDLATNELPANDLPTESQPKKKVHFKKRPFSEVVKASTSQKITRETVKNLGNEDALARILSKLDSIESFNKSIESRLNIVEQNFFAILNE